MIVIGNDDVPGIRILMERIPFQTRDAAHAEYFSILGHIEWTSPQKVLLDFSSRIHTTQNLIKYDIDFLKIVIILVNISFVAKCSDDQPGSTRQLIFLREKVLPRTDHTWIGVNCEREPVAQVGTIEPPLTQLMKSIQNICIILMRFNFKMSICFSTQLGDLDPFSSSIF